MESETVVHSIDLIVSQANVRGGRPCIIGTGLRVSDIASVMLFHHQTPGEIADWFDISLAQVHAALAYYYQHRAEIDADIREQLATARTIKEQYLAEHGSLLSR